MTQGTSSSFYSPLSILSSSNIYVCIPHRRARGWGEGSRPTNVSWQHKNGGLQYSYLIKDWRFFLINAEQRCVQFRTWISCHTADSFPHVLHLWLKKRPICTLGHPKANSNPVLDIHYNPFQLFEMINTRLTITWICKKLLHEDSHVFWARTYVTVLIDSLRRI